MDKITIGEKYYIYSIVTTLILFFFYLLGVNNSFLYSSILDYKNIKSDIFDGTVYPIEFVPDPLQLSYEQRKKNYSEIDSKYFIKTPIYNTDIFSKELETLKPGSKQYSDTIIQRLIFTVPYMGTYNFDYKEFAGSHPGVDIVVPEGTPIKNIAAGIVVDVGYQSGGFGNYVLVKHNGVILPNGSIGDIYSLYAHMSKTIAFAGNKIKAGEVIGYVGQTGTATTPHLHFQIDLATAPYSPYWPFTTNDMKLAKVGFFDGVNIGLGRENAILNTINPLKFVNENLSIQTLVEEVKTSPLVEVEKEVIIEKEIVAENTQDIKLNEDVKIETTAQVLKKEDMLKTDVELLSAVNADVILTDSSNIKLLVSNNEDLSKSLEKVDNIDDNLDLKIDETVIIPDSQSKKEINLIPENTSQTGIIENPPALVDPKLFSDIETDYKYFLELKYFKENNLISGFMDGTFRPKNNITRIESLKMILLANSINPIKDEKSEFLDISTNSWENTYVNSALDSKIVSLDNKKFYPFRNVSRVEALKLILNLAKIDFSNLENDLTLKDVASSDWYYKYVNYAVKNNLFEISDNNFYPNKPLTREELIFILYKMIKK